MRRNTFKKKLEIVATLIEPITVGIWCDLGHVEPEDRGRVRQPAKFALRAEVVADIAVVDRGGLQVAEFLDHRAHRASRAALDIDDARRRLAQEPRMLLHRRPMQQELLLVEGVLAKIERVFDEHDDLAGCQFRIALEELMRKQQ